MKQKKHINNFSFSTSFEQIEPTTFINHLLGDRGQKSLSNPIKKFVVCNDLNLEDAAQYFDESFIDAYDSTDDMINSFVNKHSSPTFNSIDELLTASISESTYKSSKVKSLSDILDGLIEDL